MYNISLLSNPFTYAPVTAILMVLMIVIGLPALCFNSIFFKLILHPFSVVRHKEYYRLFTFDYVHNDLIHLGLNLFMMSIAFLPLEHFLMLHTSHGSLKFLAIYVAAHLSGALFVTAIYRKDFDYSCSGASACAGMEWSRSSESPPVISLSSDSAQVTMSERCICFEPERLSLHAFERAFGLRTHVRTCKPKLFNTFLDQLKYGNQ